MQSATRNPDPHWSERKLTVHTEQGAIDEVCLPNHLLAIAPVNMAVDVEKRGHSLNSLKKLRVP